MNKRITYTMLCFVLLSTGKAVAQGIDTLGSMIIISTGAYQTTVADANKISENPEVKDSTQKIPVKGYGISSKKINTGFEVEPITAAQITGEPLTKLYNGLVKAGFGNYTTPYLEAWYNHLRSKEYAWGLRMKHLSSTSTLEDYGNSSFSDNEFSLYGKKFLKEHTLLGNFDYRRNALHFYGYDTKLHELDKDITFQRYNLFAANAGLMSHYSKSDRYNHDIRLSYYNLAGLFDASENNIRADGYVKTAIGKEMLQVNGLVDYYNYKTAADTVNNTIISLNPNFIADGEKYRASIGVTAAIDILSGSKFHFYPNIELSYNIFEEIIIPYAGARGGLEKNSLRTITDENPFVLPELTMNNSNRKYDIYGGLKGTLSSSMAYNASASYASIGNVAMFVNDTTELLRNKFDVIYDDGDVLTVKGELGYQHREKLRINLKGEYFNYKMKTELRAWYMPQVKISLGGNYNLKDKLVVKMDLFYLDSQYSKSIVSDSSSSTGTKVIANELRGVFDANIGLEYRYTKKLGFFLNFNNIASQRYYRYSNYPTQKFSLMGGLSWSF